jgi:Protein of unknown function (DUF2884)
MKRSLVAMALLVACGSAVASGGTVVGSKDGNTLSTRTCDIQSDYSLTTYGSAFVFTRDDGKAPRRLSLGGGKLFVDGQEAALTSADQARVGEFEGELRQLLPEVQHVTLEAIDIAFTALTEVARGMSSDPDQAIAKLENSHRRARKEIQSRPAFVFSKDGDDALAAVIDPIVSEYVPEITGSAVSLAMKMVFASDAKRADMEKRLDRMGEEIDRKVDARADKLEPLAEAMCQRMKRMDRIDNALDYRLPGGQAIELLNVEVKQTTRAP